MESISYNRLFDLSNRIARFIDERFNDKKPIVVYGHKSPIMLAAFLGCVKAGHPYYPVDTSMPRERLRDMIEVSRCDLLIKIEDIDISIRVFLAWD